MFERGAPGEATGMVSKKVEGNEDQRRAEARLARERGEAPSARGETTGASKQRTHVGRQADHEEKMRTIARGKQRAGDVPEPPDDTEPDWDFSGRGRPGYTEEHERVFQALTEAQQAHGGEAVYLDDVARGSGLPRKQTRVILHDLSAVHKLVTQLHGTDTPDLGPRFEAKPRL
jgi:hypothetical protein